MNTFAYVAMYEATGTMCVAKLAVVDTNALVLDAARLTILPVTIRGRIAVQPVVGVVRL